MHCNKMKYYRALFRQALHPPNCLLGSYQMSPWLFAVADHSVYVLFRISPEKRLVQGETRASVQPLSINSTVLYSTESAFG